jgi:hypothetical protein
LTSALHNFSLPAFYIAKKYYLLFSISSPGASPHPSKYFSPTAISIDIFSLSPSSNKPAAQIGRNTLLSKLATSTILFSS